MSLFINNPISLKWVNPPFKKQKRKKKKSVESSNSSSQYKTSDSGVGDSKHIGISNETTSTPVSYFQVSESESESTPSEDSCGEEEDGEVNEENGFDKLFNENVKLHLERRHDEPCFKISHNTNEIATLNFTNDSDSDDEDSDKPTAYPSFSKLNKLTLDDDDDDNDDDDKDVDPDDGIEMDDVNETRKDRKTAKDKFQSVLKLMKKKEKAERNDDTRTEKQKRILSKKEAKLLEKHKKRMKNMEKVQGKEWEEYQLDDWKSIAQCGEMTESSDDESLPCSDTAENLRTFSTVTMGKRWSQDPVLIGDIQPKLPSVDRGSLGLPCELPPLIVRELVLKHMLSEKPRMPAIIPDRPKVFGVPTTAAQTGYTKHKEIDKQFIYNEYNFDILDLTAPGHFDDLVRETRTPTIQKLDYDLIDEPPRIHYGWGDRDDESFAKQQLLQYCDQKMYGQNVKSASNPYDLPLNKRETVRQYAEAVKQAEPSQKQTSIVEKLTLKGRLQRIRRIRNEGSYLWNSVDEEKMLKAKQHILRYTWKGKLIKLTQYLKEPKNQKEINIQDDCGRTALHFAASWDCAKTLQVLLNVSFVKKNIQDDEGKTPLYKAVEINSIECVRVLIEHNANPRIKARDCRNPFEYCLEEKGDSALEIIKYLYSEGKMYRERKTDGVLSHLHQICLAKPDIPVLSTARVLIQCGAHINATEGMGRTPLIIATQLNKAQLVELFIKYKADARHIDLKHKSAISYARPGETCYNLVKGALNNSSNRHCSEDVAREQSDRNKEKAVFKSK